MAVDAIPEARAHSIWLILVEECGASPYPAERETFIRYVGQALSNGHEYRFMGKLGTGGKFYNDGFVWTVNCYPSDTNPERERRIAQANYRLHLLRTMPV
jgi:hypothetical protein